VRDCCGLLGLEGGGGKEGAPPVRGKDSREGQKRIRGRNSFLGNDAAVRWHRFRINVIA